MRKKNRPSMAWIVLTLTFLMQMAYAGGHLSFAVFLKPVSEQFHWSRAATAFAYTLLWWVSGFAAIFLGWLSDRIGTRKVLLFAGVVFGLGIFLSGRTHSLWEFYLYFGVLGGIGRAAARAPLLTAVLQFFNRRRGLAVGIALSGTGVGTLIFPTLARYIISTVSWRAAFTVMGIVIWIILVPAALFIRKPRPGEAEPPAAGPASRTEPPGGARGILGTPDKEWTIPAALGNRVFWLLVFTGLFCCVSHSLPLAHIVAFASDSGISDLEAASIMGVIGISAAVGRLLWGVVSDRIGPRKTVLCCIALQTVMMFQVAFAVHLLAFYVFAVGFGLGYGGVLPQYAVVTRELFGIDRFGTVYGMHSFATSLGMGTGGLLGGYIFDLSGSYFPAFMTSTALGLVAVLLASRLAFLKGPGVPSREESGIIPTPVAGAQA